MKPDQRVKWLAKACRAVSDGEANVKQVFDVLNNKKLIQGFNGKAGQRMFKVLKENLYLFSDKQQRYLTEESALALTYGEDVRSEEEEEKPAAPVNSTAASEAALRMEEMMARCRDFVRQNANSYDDRTREVQEAEKRAAEERARALAEQRKRDWKAIADWHVNLEGWERACMAASDERFERLKALKAAEDEARAAAAAVAVGEDTGERPDRDRKRRGEETGADDSEKRSRGDRDRERERDRDKAEASREKTEPRGEKGEKDRERDRDRRRRDRDARDRDGRGGDRDRSRSRRRRRSRTPPAAAEVPELPTADAQRQGVQMHLQQQPQLQQQQLPQAAPQPGQQVQQQQMKAADVSSFLSNVVHNIGSQAYDPMALPPGHAHSHGQAPHGYGQQGYAGHAAHAAQPAGTLADMLRSRTGL